MARGPAAGRRRIRRTGGGLAAGPAPAGYRTSPLRSQPLILALAARRHAQATLDGTREVYRELRAELRDHLDPAQIDGGLVALEALAAAFTRTVREVTMVEQGMRGHVWKPRL